MKKILFIVLIFINISSCKNNHKNVWTKEYEKDIAKGLDDTLKAILKNENQRKEFVIYFINKAKSTLPRGIESISSDSLRKLFAKWGNEYEQSHNLNNIDASVPWNQQTEASFRASFFKKYLKTGDKRTADKICDCIIIKLKELNPDSLKTSIPDTTMVRIVTGCKNKVAKDTAH
jgi:hypothetical protein